MCGNIFELGTGWYPVIPIAFFLNQAERVVTCDVAPLMSKARIINAIEFFLRYHKNGKLGLFIPFEKEQMLLLEDLYRQRAQLSLYELLSALNIRYIVGDVTQMNFEENSFDLIISNNTFEHIYPAILKRLLQQFKLMVKEGGGMVHFVDMSDHFAHLDSSITIYNFLQFTSRQWAWIDNTIQPQNRWRIDDYRSLYNKLEIPITEEINRPGNLKQVEKLSLAPPFREKAVVDVAISHTYLFSKMG